MSNNSDTEQIISIDGLVEVASLGVQKINSRRAPVDAKTIPPNKVEEYVKQGWEVIPSKLTKSVRIKKDKSHNVAFEDRLWGLFARMKFDLINETREFTLAYGKELNKQIDVFCCDSEVALVVEAKSSAVRQKVYFQKEIHEFAFLQNDLRASISKLFPHNPKIVFIFATNKCVLSDKDSSRLKENNIHHFNQDTIEYYEGLTEHLGEAAKYQLFGNLLAGQLIPNLPTRVPAISGKTPTGKTFYSFSIDPKVLLKISYVLHRNDTTSETSDAYQRLIKKRRLKQIGDFIDKGGYFPNSIIINIQEKHLKFEPATRIQHDSKTDFGILHLPRKFKSAFIIDGQHRLFGYSKSVVDQNHTIPVVAFHNLPEDEQTQIFVDINHSQKSVPTSLLHSLMADFHWDSSNDRLAIGALKTRLLTRLNQDEKSPFYQRIVLAEEPKTDTRCLTLQTIRSSGFGGTNYFGKLKGDKLISYGYLTEGNHENTLNKAALFFSEVFSEVENKLSGQWNAGSDSGGFIAMNLGVIGVMRVADSILEHLSSSQNLSTENKTGKQLAERVIPYLESVFTFISNLDTEGLKKIRSLFGGGAPDKVLREFQFAIHQDFEDFNPKGLDQWIKDTSGKYNKQSYDLGYSKIEPLLDDSIKQKLREEFGNQWWNSGIPKNVQKSCSDSRIDHGSGSDENFLCTIHYRDIIKQNWNLLGELFTEPGKENAAKDKKISWLVKFNSIRQKYSHPQRENITEAEYDFLRSLWEWLDVRLSTK